MEITIRKDDITQEISVTETGCDDEFVYAALANYLGIKCRDLKENKNLDNEEALEKSLQTLNNICVIASDMIKEKYRPKKKQFSKKKRG